MKARSRFDSKRQHILSTLGEYFEREVLCNVKPFRDSFGYLYNTNHILYSNYVGETPPKSPNEIMLNNYHNLLMEPYAAMFIGRKDIGVKVVKIKDFNWFPHLRPELYSSKMIQSIESKFGWKRKNFDNLLPFI